MLVRIINVNVFQNNAVILSFNFVLTAADPLEYYLTSLLLISQEIHTQPSLKLSPYTKVKTVGGGSGTL